MRHFLIPCGVFIFLACNSNNNANKADDLKADTVLQETLAPEPVASDTTYTGFGTEPFWSVYVIGTQKIVFHPADGPDVEVPFVAATTPDAITTRYISSGGGNSMELTFQKNDCSDGMSEMIHPFRVDLLLNNVKYSGCGRMGK